MKNKKDFCAGFGAQEVRTYSTLYLRPDLIKMMLPLELSGLLHETVLQPSLISKLIWVLLENVNKYSQTSENSITYINLNVLSRGNEMKEIICKHIINVYEDENRTGYFTSILF